tara:strand:+ start:221 stop:487 length:267 start_codon:yes stop_codon:yes gene_type:complete
VKEITPKVLEHGAAGLTAVAGTTTTVGSYFQFLNDNAPGLGVLLTFFFGCVATGFHIYNSKSTSESKKQIKILQDTLSKVGQRKTDKQ